MSCHDPAAAAPVTVATRRATVALVGSPNVGKSTLFNAATGARQHVVNAPGTTVELATGVWKAADVTLVDLPGAYSLLARTPDEQVTADAVAGRGSDVDLVVAMVDATAVARSLYLVGQVARAGRPLLVALTMRDVAADRGVEIDPAALSGVLGVPVIGVDPRTGHGLDELARAVRAAVTGGAPAAHVRGAAGPAPAADDASFAEAEALFGWVQGVLAVVQDDRPALLGARARRTWSDRVDSVLLRPWAGIPVLLGVMWALFQLVTVAAAPLMRWVAGAVTGWFGGLVRGWLSGAPAWAGSFVVDGVLAGVATVLSFAPLIGIMFVAVALLEDSGYLARAAFVADRAMRALGLDGRAVLPLVVGFGCNVPALAATRTLPHARQRLLTGLLVPLTSCTARLTVYLVLAAVFFPHDAGIAVLAMYLLSALLVVGLGVALRHTAFRDLAREPFVLALPAYQRPRLRAIGTSAGVRVWAFVHKAGSIIVVTLAAVWVLMALPAGPGHARRRRAGPGLGVRTHRRRHRAGVPARGLRRLARGVRAPHRVRREGGRRRVDGADLRGDSARGPEPARRPGHAAARHVRPDLRRRPGRSGVRVHGVRPRLHPVPGDDGRAGPAVRPRLGGRGDRRPAAARLGPRRRRVPGRQAAVTVLAGRGSPRRTAPPATPAAVGTALFAQVLQAADRGLTADRIAERLGLSDELVRLALDHAERIGLVVRPAGSSCATGCPAGPARPPTCASCPLSR